MKYVLYIFILLSLSCAKIEVEDNPLYFFWEEMDRKYVFFEEKQIDWNSVRSTLHRYDPNNTTDLVAGFTSMIEPLKDRHVWVSSEEETITYNPDANYFFSTVNLNFYSTGKIEENDFYTIAQLPGGIVFVELNSFLKPFPYFEWTIKEYDYSNGIIIDIRHNSGGYLPNALDLAFNFISGKRTVLYQKFKNGRGHNDFTGFKPLSLEGSNRFPDTRIVLLADIMTYSAANLFASVMKEFTGAVLVGAKTGGGGASSILDVLPNGWAYSISQNASFDAAYRSLEQGVSPHYEVLFDKEQYEEEKPRHNQMEFALKLLTENNQKTQ